MIIIIAMIVMTRTKKILHRAAVRAVRKKKFIKLKKVGLLLQLNLIQIVVQTLNIEIAMVG